MASSLPSSLRSLRYPLGTFMELDPNTIIIEQRQRQSDLNITPEFVSSIKKKVIHPIVLRKLDDQIILVVGERRLTAMKTANINPIIENEHFRFFDNLPPLEAKIIELEENVKRDDLSWRDRTRSYSELHTLLSQSNPNWTIPKTCDSINVGLVTLNRYLVVAKHLDNPAIAHADGIIQAYGILQSIAERRAVVAVGNITNIGREIFAPISQGPEDDRTRSNPINDLNRSNPINHIDNVETYSPSFQPPTENTVVDRNLDRNHDNPTPILNIDFQSWIADYSGDKFTFIHCDFPYDVQYQNYAHSVTSSREDYNHAGFFPLLDILLNNLDKIASYSSHLMIWFGMEFYQKTKFRLEEAGLFVHAHPFIWLKSDNAGIIPGRDNIYPRRIYETAFLCTRGRRPLVSSKANAYSAPTPSSTIHSSQKSIPVLHHFFSMLIDETTTVLDPTCGSGSAIIAAEDMKAASVVGLEIDSDYAKAANAAVNRARALRSMTQ